MSFSQEQFLTPFILAPKLFVRVTKSVEFKMYFIDWNNKTADSFKLSIYSKTVHCKSPNMLSLTVQYDLFHCSNPVLKDVEEAHG